MHSSIQYIQMQDQSAICVVLCSSKMQEHFNYKDRLDINKQCYKSIHN